MNLHDGVTQGNSMRRKLGSLNRLRHLWQLVPRGGYQTKKPAESYPFGQFSDGCHVNQAFQASSKLGSCEERIDRIVPDVEPGRRTIDRLDCLCAEQQEAEEPFEGPRGLLNEVVGQDHLVLGHE